MNSYNNSEDFQKLIQEILNQPLKYRSIKKDYDISKNVDASICTECGGACCKICGCHFSPDDFKDITFEELKKEIEKRYISIDCVDREILYSDTSVYFLRIRNIHAPIVDTGYRRTPCILLTEKGCKLDYEQRPTGGKLLIPNTMSSANHMMACFSKYSIRECCYEWKPHQMILCELKEYFQNKDIPCSL